MNSEKNQIYDLEDRLLEYTVSIIKIVEQLPNSRTGNHVGGQLLKIGDVTLSKSWRGSGSRVTQRFHSQVTHFLEGISGKSMMVEIGQACAVDQRS